MVKKNGERANGGKSRAGKRDATTQAAGEGPDSFSVKHTRIQFLIATTMAVPDFWDEFKRRYLHQYLSLEDEQYELQIQEEERDFEAGTHPLWAPLVDPDVRRETMPLDELERRLHAELEEESSRTLGEYERVYGGKEEKDKGRSRSGKNINRAEIPPGDPRFIGLDGRDPAVRELRDSIQDWLHDRGLGEDGCMETMVSVMTRQKAILDKAHVRSIPKRNATEWVLAWTRRFYTFIDDLKETLARCGIEGATFTPSLLKAWREEWVRSGQNSRFKDSLVPLPPSGYPLWLPDFEEDTEYMRAVESEAKRELRHGSLLSSVIGNAHGKLVKKIMVKAREYCRQVKESRKVQKGIKREKAKPEQVKHIVWAVQYQVMKMDPEDIARLSKAEKGAVNKGIRTVLKAMHLQSRGEPGRPKGKRDSDQSRRSVLKRSR